MRTLPCLAALALATASLLPRIADACGGSYEAMRRPPKLALISTHWNHESATQRAFAVFPAKAAVNRWDRWIALSPMSYDNAKIVERPDTGTAPVTLTLVGESGTKVITAERRVVLSHSYWIDMAAHDAIEVPSFGEKESFSVAIIGAVYNASWSDLAKAGLTERTSYPDSGPVVEISQGKLSLGTYPGYALGVVTMRGTRYLVTKDGPAARAYELP